MNFQELYKINKMANPGKPVNELLAITELELQMVERAETNFMLGVIDIQNSSQEAQKVLPASSEEKKVEEKTFEIIAKYKNNPGGSFREDKLVCLVCGEEHEYLKGHLKQAHKLTPADYYRITGLNPKDKKYSLTCQKKRQATYNEIKESQTTGKSKEERDKEAWAAEEAAKNATFGAAPAAGAITDGQEAKISPQTAPDSPVKPGKDADAPKPERKGKMDATA